MTRAMTGPWLARRTLEATCTVDIEQTAESFHAYAVPVGVEIAPGDEVMVHGAPIGIAFGDRISRECRITVVKVGWLERRWAQLTGLLELTELYEVGFLPKETSS